MSLVLVDTIVVFSNNIMIKYSSNNIMVGDIRF
jgi:hypothetical protein